MDLQSVFSARGQLTQQYGRLYIRTVKTVVWFGSGTVLLEEKKDGVVKTREKTQSQLFKTNEISNDDTCSNSCLLSCHLNVSNNNRMSTYLIFLVV